MAAVKRGAAKAAAPVRKTAARKASVAAGGQTTDLIGVRMTSLNYARSLFGGQSEGSPEPITSASKLVTQAKRIERYILGIEAGDDV